MVKTTERHRNKGNVARYRKRRESVHHYGKDLRPFYRQAEQGAPEVTADLRRDTEPNEPGLKEKGVSATGFGSSRGLSPYKLRDAWVQTITSNDRLCFFPTITFLYDYSDARAYEGLRKAMKLINRSVWGRNWHKHTEKAIAGFVIAEPHEISLDRQGALHFHLMLEARHGLTLDSLTQGLHYAVEHTRGPRGGLMTRHDLVDVREIYDRDGLADYLTKTFTRKYWNPGDNISFLSHEGLSGVTMGPRRH